MNYSLSMLVPAYNEEELLEIFIRKSMRDLSAVSNDFEIVLVNDGSTDRTKEIAERLIREFPSNLKFIDLKENQGTGKSILPAFKVASKEIVFVNTVDAFFNTEDLTLLLPYLDSYDIVSGYRSDLRANNLYQKVLTLCNYWLIRILFGMKLKAYQTVQFHHRPFFDHILIEAQSSFISPELLYKAMKLGKTFKEVKIMFHPRKAGKGKGGNFKNVRKSIMDIFKFFILWRVLGRINIIQHV